MILFPVTHLLWPEGIIKFNIQNSNTVRRINLFQNDIVKYLIGKHVKTKSWYRQQRVMKNVPYHYIYFHLIKYEDNLWTFLLFRNYNTTIRPILYNIYIGFHNSLINSSNCVMWIGKEECILLSLNTIYQITYNHPCRFFDELPFSTKCFHPSTFYL